MDFNFIFGQIFGVLATCLTILSYQVNTKNRLLIIQSIATLCTAISYLFLGALSGLVMNIVCIARNVVFYFQKEDRKQALISGYAFALAMVICGAFSWQGWPSLLIISALAANTVFLSFGKPQLLRKSILLTSSLVLVYNLLVFSVGGIANEVMAIASSIVGILRFHKAEKKTVRETKL